MNPRNPFTEAYREWETKPRNRDRAAYFARKGTNVPEQMNRVPISARLAYVFLFGVVRPICEAFAWAEGKWRNRK